PPPTRPLLPYTTLFRSRLVRRGDEVLFRRLETLGDHAARLFDQPDAGLWELRGKPRVHTFSSVMCWAGCERLARIATHLGLAERSEEHTSELQSRGHLV